MKYLISQILYNFFIFFFSFSFIESKIVNNINQKNPKIKKIGNYSYLCIIAGLVIK